MTKDTANKIINVFSIFMKFVFPFFATIHMLVWITNFISEGLFNKLDSFTNFIPNIMDNIFHITADIDGRDILMGHVYTALMFLVFSLFCFFITKELNSNFHNFKESKPKIKPNKEAKKIQSENQKTIRKYTIENIQEKQKAKKEKEKDITSFYGLLTFELKYLNDGEIEEETQKTIKHEYTKIIVEKLKEKYDTIKCAISDKAFFICNNASLFNLFVRDIAKLNKIISQISQERKIKTALKVCFWSNISANPKQAYSILLRIDKLNYLNKIIVSKEIQKKFSNQLIKCFDFCSLGEIELSKLNSDEEDIELELFYLKTLDT